MSADEDQSNDLTNETDDPGTAGPAATEAEPDAARIDAAGRDANPKDELFEAIDHFKHAASLFFDKATKSPAVSKLEKAIESASEKADGWTEKIDPAFESASKEAERVISKLGATAEPLAKQLTSELRSLTKRFGEVARGGGRRRPPPPADEPDEPKKDD